MGRGRSHAKHQPSDKQVTVILVEKCQADTVKSGISMEGLYECSEEAIEISCGLQQVVKGLECFQWFGSNGCSLVCALAGGVMAGECGIDSVRSCSFDGDVASSGEAIASPIERMSWCPRSIARIIKSVNEPERVHFPAGASSWLPQ